VPKAKSSVAAKTHTFLQLLLKKYIVIGLCFGRVGEYRGIATPANQDSKGLHRAAPKGVLEASGKCGPTLEHKTIKSTKRGN